VPSFRFLQHFRRGTVPGDALMPTKIGILKTLEHLRNDRIYTVLMCRLEAPPRLGRLINLSSIGGAATSIEQNPAWPRDDDTSGTGSAISLSVVTELTGVSVRH
jgi:hypothetical protein